MYKSMATLAVLGALVPAARAEDDLPQRLDAVLEQWIGDERIVGAVVLVARYGQVVYRRAAGWADREARVPVREDTIFRLASMTKLIVSTVALRLVDEGRLSLDDPVSRWLPYFTPALSDGRRPAITIRQLLSHTSGLSYSFFEPPGNAYRTLRVPQGLARFDGSLEEALRRLASAPLFYEPGREWRYSLSTDVLGAVIERVTGLPLPRAVERYVTEPLGMHDTAFRLVEPARLAAAYVDGTSRAERMRPQRQPLRLGNGVHVDPERTLDPAAYSSGGGGMTGTADDFLTLVEAIRTVRAPVISESMARRLTTHHIGDLRAWTEGPGWGFGLGTAVLLDPAAADSPQSVGTWQWGGALGTHWFVDPVRALSVVVMTNTAVAGVIGEFPAAMRDAVYGVTRPR